jgi:hypothetical protein
LDERDAHLVSVQHSERSVAKLELTGVQSCDQRGAPRHLPSIKFFERAGETIMMSAQRRG